MTAKKRNIISLIFLLAVMVVVTTVFVIAFTFAGSPDAPDAIATYYKGTITWNVPTDASGAASLNFFGEPENGEEYPLISPASGDTYYLRLKNNADGNINYKVFLYTEADNPIPLKFDVLMDESMQSAEQIPENIENEKILSSFTGQIRGRELKDFQIHWYWDSESDSADTSIGNSAALFEMIYPINVLIVVDDNNNYETPESGTSKPAPQITTSDTIGKAYARKAYVQGYPDKTFRPDNNMTRAEVSAIFARINANFDEALIKGSSEKFPDVAKTDWFNKYIAELEDDKIITGYGDGNFRPENNITRAEFAAIAVRFLESKIGTIIGRNADFSDMSSPHWAKVYVEKAVAKGLIKGYPDKTFRPDNPITRAEVVTIVNRLLTRIPDKKLIDLETVFEFIDATDPEYWAYYEIYEAANDIDKLSKESK